MSDRASILIRCCFVYPPIPSRKFDWVAYDDAYEPDDGEPVGYGKTCKEAVIDLLDQLEAQHD